MTHSKSSGIVSIMVTMIMMVVISLVVLGFAEIARHEQRSSLDTQLGTQAYYAAESGINDARSAISTFITSGQPVPSKLTTCGTDINYTSAMLPGTVNASNNVTYTCVLIDPTPSTLTYTLGYTSKVIPLISSSGAFGGVTLRWQPASGTSSSVNNCFGSGTPANTFYAANSAQWACPYPVLRLDILNSNGTLQRSSWDNGTSTIFLVPFKSGGVSSMSIGGPAIHGTVVPVNCTAANCSFDMTGMGGTSYYMRATTLYLTNSQLLITANGGKKFADAEALIDSTGKAQDVLKRIQVAVDLTDANSRKIPTAAIVSQDSVCKRFGTTNNYFEVFDDLSSGGGGNSMCNVTSIGAPMP